MKLIRSSLFFGVFLLSISLFAQNFSDVNKMSDSEIEAYWSKAQSRGITIDKLKSYAMERGMSTVQADLLVSRIQEVSAGSGELSPPVTSLEENDRTTRFEPNSKLKGVGRKLFGSEFFGSSKIDYTPNVLMPTPEGYILGPRDQISIQIYGSSQQSYLYTIAPDGRISIPLIGPVSLSGLTIEAAKSLLINVLGNIYSGLKQKPATVFLDLTLRKFRTIRVNVIGEVKAPGTVTLPSTANSFAALYATGGPSINGTYRDIKVYRSGDLVETLDLYDFFSTGIMPSVITLQDEDIIVVGPYYKHVEVKGLVKLPSVFEIKPGQKVRDLIALSGGFGPGAVTDIVTLERLNGEDQIIRDLPVDDTSFDLEDGDQIMIRKAIDALVEKVQIEGAVLRPGTFGWSEGFTLGDLLTKAGQLTPEAYKAHANLFRKKPDLSTEVVALNLEDNWEEAVSMELQIGDLVVIPSRYQLSETPFVQVSGRVLKPGVLPFFKGMTISDAIVLSSGLTVSAFSGSIELVRRPSDTGEDFEVSTYPLKGGVFAFEGDELAIELEAYDHIFVRQTEGFLQPEIVTVVGEVVTPGEYVLENRDIRISDLYKRSGGITEYAYVEGAHLLRANRGSNPNIGAKIYLQQLERLNLVLKRKLAGGTLSNVETIALEKRLDQLRGNYRQLLLNDRKLVGDSASFWTVDSVYTDLTPSYSKIAFNLQDLMDGKLDPGNDLILRNGDKLVIPAEPQTVVVSGEVLNGKTVARYQEGLRLNDYVAAAGGYTNFAKRGKPYVVYPNGSANRTRNFLFFRDSPPVLPGSRIIIPGGKVRESFNAERIFSLVTTAATTYLLFLTIQDRQSN